MQSGFSTVHEPVVGRLGYAMQCTESQTLRQKMEVLTPLKLYGTGMHMGSIRIKNAVHAYLSSVPMISTPIAGMYVFAHPELPFEAWKYWL